jgi:putative ABC transport system substrate-binding protein
MKLVLRRQFLFGSTALLAAPLASIAQQPGARQPRVAFLISETTSDSSVRMEAMRGGLRDLGYVDGKNMVIEIRAADGNYARLPELATTLVQRRSTEDGAPHFAEKNALSAKPPP